MEPIAVIGLSLRFPGDAVTSDTFWKILTEKQCTLTDWPKERLNIDSYHDASCYDRSSVAARGANFLKEDPNRFDAAFFSTTASEASAMDPQQSLLLETTYRALENAGLPLDTVRGSNTGVYSGCMCDDHKLQTLRDIDNIPKYAATGVSSSILANRISWFFDLAGPSISLDTACSSSLVALHLACQGLVLGETALSLVTGSNILSGLESLIAMTRMGFLSPDGRCYSFDERANGYARGEGVGVVVLKRLSDAVSDNDTIRAVIRSTGVNQDGHTPGITVPSKDRQAHLIRETYNKANLDLAPTRYFEAHGTGTPVGDPIEAAAIGEVFRDHHSASDPVYIGTLKPNIGHLEGASGVAALIKAILVLEHGTIPPNANLERLNPKIQKELLYLKFPTGAIPWPVADVRRASINSFGFGGTNAHAILDDAYGHLRSKNLEAHHSTIVHREQSESDSTTTHGSLCESDGLLEARPSDKLLVWSANDENAIHRTMNAFALAFAKDHDGDDRPRRYCEDLAYTLSCRRTHFPWRSFAVLESPKCLGKLQQIFSEPMRSKKSTGLAFVFTGQGAQYRRMGLQFLRYRTFRTTLTSCGDAFTQLGCQWTIFDELEANEEDSKIDHPARAQPLCTALQIALVELLRSFAVVPLSVVGHSSGEIAAAYAAGAISLNSACKLAYYRGQLAGTLVDSSSEGAMLAVALPEHEVMPYLKRINVQAHSRITVACINSPSSVTIGGDRTQILTLKGRLDIDGVFCRELKTGVAYHSQQMQLIADRYLQAIGRLEPGEEPSTITVVSSVTGDYIPEPDMLRTPDYWVRNMVQPVRFSDALLRLLSGQTTPRKQGQRDYANLAGIVEIGPHATLQRPVEETLRCANSKLQYLSALSRFDPSVKSLLRLAGYLYCSGFPVRLDRVNGFEASDEVKYKCLTDLPEYSFSHQYHSSETWLADNLRQRPHFPRPLLGAPAPDWNPLEPKWRQNLNTQDLPWLMDHQINGVILFPAAGMLAIALEAADQTAHGDRNIEGFHFKDIIFANPIVISTKEEIGTEIETYLQPTWAGSEKFSARSQVRISVHQGNQWVQTFRATVHVEYSHPSMGLKGASGAKLRSRDWESAYKSTAQKCNQRVNNDNLYAHLSQMGLRYGHVFQRLRETVWDQDDSAIGRIDASTLDLTTTRNDAHRYIMHPATLDSIIQLAWVPITKGATRPIPTSVPSRLRYAWFSGSWLGSNSKQQLQACSTAASFGLKRTESSTIAVDSAGKVAVALECLETLVTASEHMQVQDVHKTRLCFKLETMPDISLLEPHQLMSFLVPNFSGHKEQSNLYGKLDAALKFFISSTLSELTAEDIEGAKPQIRRYVDWMKSQARLYGTCDETTPSEERLYLEARQLVTREQLVEDARKKSRGELYMAVGHNLLPIIRNQLEPVDVIQRGHLIKQFYADLYQSIASEQRLLPFITILSHKNPEMRIMEIGPGTGGMADVILGPLLEHEGHATLSFSSYDVSEVSTESLDTVRMSYTSLCASGRMQLHTLDLNREPGRQGVDHGSYDLVLATDALYATRDLKQALRNIRKLLKLGGKLILLEAVKPQSLRSAFIFGLLPNWWLSSDFRSNHSDMYYSARTTEAQWSRLLSESGFSGMDAVVRDHELEGCHEYSFMFSTAVEACPTPSVPLVEFVVVINSDSELQKELAFQIQLCMVSAGHAEPTVLPLTDITETRDIGHCRIIFLPEYERSFLCGLSEPEYLLLKHLLGVGEETLWITKYDLGSESWPRSNAVAGLARVIRSENPSHLFVTLAFEHSGRPQEDAGVICRVLQGTLHAQEPREMEFISRKGVIQVQRIVEANDLDEHVSRKTVPQDRLLSLADTGPIALTIEGPGVFDSLHCIPDIEHDTGLAPGEVEVKVQAIGLNFKDVIAALGRLDKDTLGIECAGLVHRVGPGTSLKPGDRVLAGAHSCMKTFARAHQDLVVEIPVTLSFEEAAALPVVGCTAYYSVIEMGRLQRNESILIHSGAGATGQMCIQIAVLLGAEVFATVSTEDKKQFLISRYGLCPDHIFYSRDTSFAMGIMGKTSNRGVDMVVNSLGGDGLVASWEVIAPFGRFIELGKEDIRANTALPMAYFAKNVSFIAVAFDDISTLRPALARKLLLAVTEMVGKGELCPPYPLQTYPLSGAEKAFRHLLSGKSTGKIVLTVHPSDVVKIHAVENGGLRLNPDVSYVIAGGLGGLGRSVARWMTSKGARNLILLSRAGPESEPAQALLRDLRELGIRVEAPACDVSSEDELNRILLECAKDMPPVKGCIQGTMVLRDSLFENMTYTDWNISLRSKVQTSWNLHKLLPKGMDFFILLSSLSGIIGVMGQSNYAAGNTFQDALAQFRIESGERAISLDLGVMSKVGIVAENAEVARSATREMHPVQEDEFHALLEYFCDPKNCDMGGQGSGQVLVGLPAHGAYRSKDIDCPPTYSHALFSALRHLDMDSSTAKSTEDAGATTMDYARDFKAATSTMDAEAVVVTGLTEKLSKALSISPEEIDPTKPLHQYGVDSLVAVELRNWFGKDFGASVAIFHLMGASSILAVGKLVAEASTVRKRE